MSETVSYPGDPRRGKLALRRIELLIAHPLFVLVGRRGEEASGNDDIQAGTV